MNAFKLSNFCNSSIWVVDQAGYQGVRDDNNPRCGVLVHPGKLIAAKCEDQMPFPLCKLGKHDNKKYIVV